MSNDPYTDPSTGVLLNKLGISDPDELSRAEADLTYLMLARLEARSLPGKYDLAHLRSFHKTIFGDLYPWAGELRTVLIAKGHPFCLPQFIQSASDEIFFGLAREGYLRGLRRSEFAGRLAFYLGEINAIHPFREGNGRTQRAFFGQLARDAGFIVNWRRLDADRNIEASIAIMRGDPEPMRSMLDELVEPV
ncbi:Fic family protein [Actinoallomurus purpureus]|uniref:Fic/DOC family protein n=1 Tax=Actinoallomurus purpureus TaxID=478114 RepID=UPI002092D368|nr:Fic family protein [Actinoallomurus purpureus]MCO6005674.1 Fic family protein [Actinoallomurus purpureus]